MSEPSTPLAGLAEQLPVDVRPYQLQGRNAGLVIVDVLRPGSGIGFDPATADPSAVAAYTGAAQQSHGSVDFLLNIIPETVVGAFARGDVLQVLVFAVLRFAMAARDARTASRSTTGAENAFLSAALQEALQKVKAQERATAARAEASERLSGEIISSLTAGLLVVGLNREIRILNPAGRQMLEAPGVEPTGAYQRSAREQPLFDVIDECLSTLTPIVRRAVVLDANENVTHLGVSVSPLSDEEGKTPLDVAIEANHADIVDVLRSRGVK